MSIDISIIIPNFNGRGLLKENLPVLFSVIEKSRFASFCEVIIVDDGSTDDSCAFIRDNFSQARLIELDSNHGFAYSCNKAAEEAAGNIIYLLNSDIKVYEGFLDPIPAHFNNKDTFAVSSAEVPIPGTSDPTKEVVIPLLKFKWGIFWYRYEHVPNEAGYPCEIFCVSGGHSAFDRRKFLELGGFDNIFRPFYGEDGDICWRAWKKGWKSIYEPGSVVLHAGQGTISRYYTRAEIQNIHWKNRFLMTWKNLDSGFLLFKHSVFIIPEILFCLVTGKKEFAIGFYFALKQLPELLRSRKRDKVVGRARAFSNKAFFEHFSRPPRFLPIKVLYLQESSRISGAEKSLMKLAEKIDKTRFTPIFIVSAEGPFSHKLRMSGFEVIIIDFPKIRRIAGTFAAIKKIFRIVKERNITIIHANSIRTNIYAAIIARLAGIPAIWHQRNLITNELIDLDRLFDFMPDAIVCNSRAIAKRFLRISRLPAKVRVIHNGVDANEFNPAVSGAGVRKEFNIKADEIVVGIASRFNEYKGHEVFFEAVKIILTDMPELADKIRFLVTGGAVFTGDEWREKYTRDLAARLGIGDKVIFTGFRNDMPEIYSAMDIFVIPSRAEACGRVILEAMASGKPVVATGSGGTPEIVMDGAAGYLVNPDDARMLADKIVFLVQNKNIMKKFGEIGRKKIEESFKIEYNAKKTEDIYNELLEKYHFSR